MLNEKQIQLINGSLLGDGSLHTTKYGNSCFRETHCFKQKAYLTWKKEILNPFSKEVKIRLDGKIYKKEDKIARNKNNLIESYFFITKYCSIFSEFEKKWYLRDDYKNYILDKNKRRIKIVPRDLCLTPFSIGVWYLDDGSKRDRQSCRIATHSFTREDCYFLIDQIKQFNIKNVYLDPKINQIYIRSSIDSYSYLDFIDLIREGLGIIPDCMKYKLDMNNYIPPKFSCQNKCGKKGVYFNKQINKWKASIYINKKRKNLGSFNSVEEAIKARENAEQVKEKLNEDFLSNK